MTKRTAALAAAANISSKARKVVKKDSNFTSNKKLAADTSTKKKLSTTSSKSEPQLPWYTVYTKSDPEYDKYMSTEWGMEKRGDVALFEKICLEGAQSGLSWLTILRKREAYRKTFFNFDIAKVAKMTDKDVQKILDTNEEDPRDMVVRHRGKIEATIHNAKCIQKMYDEEKEDDAEHGLFDNFLWGFVRDKPILNTQWKQGQGLSEALSKSPESQAMSKALKKHGFRFVGPTTCYAMMQSVGMVIDHPVDSPEWQAALERLKKRPGGYQQGTDRSSSSEDEGLKDSKPKAKQAKTSRKKSNK